jgi:spermidine/putrescine transport system substrate-binding protein
LKKWCVVLVAVLMIMAFSGCSGSKTVTVYNWGEYLDEDLNNDFEKETGIKVKYRFYESNEILYANLSGGGATYDVIIPSDYMIGQMIEEDMLMELDLSKIPNYKYIMDSAKGYVFDPGNKYSVAYMTGTVGIVYNKTLVNRVIDSWDILFDPDYAGEILMFSNPRDAFGIALQYLGYSINTTDESQLLEAKELLLKQKPLVQTYLMDQIYDKMGGNEATVGPYYAGDVAMMMEDNEDLAFARPKESFNGFVDAFCIPKGAKNIDAAYAYINYMCSLDAGIRNVDATGYTTPLSHVQDALDEETRENEMIYPSAETMSRSEVFNTLPKATRKLYDEMWVEILSD